MTDDVFIEPGGVRRFTSDRKAYASPDYAQARIVGRGTVVPAGRRDGTSEGFDATVPQEVVNVDPIPNGLNLSFPVGGLTKAEVEEANRARLGTDDPSLIYADILQRRSTRQVPPTPRISDMPSESLLPAPLQPVPVAAPQPTTSLPPQPAPSQPAAPTASVELVLGQILYALQELRRPAPVPATVPAPAPVPAAPPPPPPPAAAPAETLDDGGALNIPFLRVEPQPPELEVFFDLGERGTMSGHYHGVVFDSRKQHCLVLVYDLRFKYGQKYVPPRPRDPDAEPIVLGIGDRQWRCHPSPLNVELGSLMLIFFVLNPEQPS